MTSNFWIPPLFYLLSKENNCDFFSQGNFSRIHESITGASEYKICGIDYCPSTTTIQTKSHPQNSLDNHELHTRHILFSIFMGIATCGIIFAIVFLSSELKDDDEENDDVTRQNGLSGDEKDNEQQLSLTEKLKEIFLLMRDTNLLKLIPLMMGVGAIHGFTYGDLTKVGFSLEQIMCSKMTVKDCNSYLYPKINRFTINFHLFFFTKFS